MSNPPLEDSYEREQLHREQLAHIEDMMAVLDASQQAIQKQAKDNVEQRKTFAAEQQRLQVLIGKELANRHNLPDKSVSASQQEFRQATTQKKPASKPKKMVSKQGIEAAEKKLSEARKVGHVFSPPGLPKNAQAKQAAEIVKLVAEMKEQMGRKNGQAKTAFENSVKPPSVSRGRR